MFGLENILYEKDIYPYLHREMCGRHNHSWVFTSGGGWRSCRAAAAGVSKVEVQGEQKEGWGWTVASSEGNRVGAGGGGRIDYNCVILSCVCIEVDHCFLSA